LLSSGVGSESELHRAAKDAARAPARLLAVLRADSYLPRAAFGSRAAPSIFQRKDNDMTRSINIHRPALRAERLAPSYTTLLEQSA